MKIVGIEDMNIDIDVEEKKVSHSFDWYVISIFKWIISMIFASVVMIMTGYGAYAIWDNYDVIESAHPMQYLRYDPQKDPLSFEDLVAINPDVFGWLNIYGTNIDYPLLQGKNDQAYLAHNPQGRFSSSGSIFLDCSNKKDFSDFNSVIYGHHMEQGVMFGDIDKFLKEDFFNTHKYGSIYFDKKEHGLELFEIMLADAYDFKLYGVPTKQENKKAEMLDYYREKALYWREVNLTTSDHIILMSTCATDSTNGRYILLGRITEEMYINEFAKPAEKFTVFDKIKSLESFLPLWGWALVLLLLIALISLHLNKKIKKRVRTIEILEKMSKIE